MRKNYILAYSAVLFTLSSCLDTEPETAIDADNVIADQKSAEVALVGAYSGAQSFAGVSVVAFNSAADNVVASTSTLNVIPHLQAAGSSAFDPTSGGGYNTYYSAINLINSIIDGVNSLNDGAFTGSNKSRILGEAHFLRALAYFDLARTYGRVPIVLHPSTSGHSADGITQSSREEVYAQVLADLTEAESLFDNSLSSPARASIWSAYALHARLALYTEDWQSAATYASKVIESGLFSLTTTPDGFFSNKLSSEAILELVFSTSDRNPFFTYYLSAAEGGRLDYVPNPEFVQILNEPSVAGLRSQFVKVNSNGIYVIREYDRQDGSSSIFLLRLAEQYLIRAEARAHLGDLDGAVEDLNVIRRRAAVEEISTSGLSVDAFLLALETERRVELAFEGHRYSDVIRTGRAAEVFGAYNENYKDSRYWVFPLPNNVILADPDLTQNPGY
ncbi:MAG: RagB/SusD family nutrient uptake outer membrane protein [Bacteroidales bacterium]|nr:RagB/SusD family nutrient uptake outer membrane protein [Bacteroidales bacterium]